MLLIAFISVLIGIIGLAILVQLYRLIKARINDEENKPSVKVLVASFVLALGLGIYDIYLVFSYLNENKEEILDAGQKAISNTIEYGTTAVFEGIGQSIDHFENKWEEEYIRRLKKVEFEIQDYNLEPLDSNLSTINLNVIATNNNEDKEWLNLGDLDKNNYVLISDENELFYPLNFSTNQYENFLPKGKTVLRFQGQVPSKAKLKYFRVLNEKWLIE